MIMQKEFLTKLKDFGLNSYEAAIWTALLSRGVSTAGELSDIANVPRSRSYDILESLEKKGFIIMKVGKPIKYLAVPPEEVIERVKKRIRGDAERQAGVLEEVRQSEVLSELTRLHNNGVEMVDPSEITTSLKGRENIHSQIETLIKGAQNEVVIVTSPEGAERKFQALQRHIKKASQRGVTFRFGIAGKVGDDLNQLLSEYGEVRASDNLQGRFVLVDNKHLLFMLMDDASVHPSYDTAVWAQTSHFTSAVKQMLEKVW